MTPEDRFARRSTPVAVIGQGYVGLPLAVEFARAGFRVFGIDVNAKRIGLLARGKSYIQDVASSELAPLVREGRLRPTTDFSVLKKAGAVSMYGRRSTKGCSRTPRCCGRSTNGPARR